MTPPQTSHPKVSADFVARLADRAGEAEKQRRLPQATIADYRDSGLARLLLPKRYGGCQAEFPEILEVVRLMAHGCTSSAWTLGFYTLRNWMLALFGEQAQPAAQVRLGDARVRLRAMRGLAEAAAQDIQARVGSEEHIDRKIRSGVRAEAAHVVRESRAVIADLLESSGASAQFLDHPQQHAKRDVDMISGHVVFDYDGSRELAGALEIGAKVSPFAMV